VIKKLRKGDDIVFRSVSGFCELILTGTVLGNAKAVRKQFPVECDGATDCYLVKTVDNFGNDYLYVVHPEEIIEEI